MGTQPPQPTPADRLPGHGEGLTKYNYPIHDWTILAGAYVQIRRAFHPSRQGHVEATTEDGSILWLRQEGAETRRLFEKAEGYEVWAASVHTPLLYEAANAPIGPPLDDSP